MYSKQVRFEVLEQSQRRALTQPYRMGTPVHTLLGFKFFLNGRPECVVDDEIVEMASMLVAQLAEIEKMDFYPLWLRVVSNEIDFEGFTMINVENRKLLMKYLDGVLHLRGFSEMETDLVPVLKAHPRCAEALKLLKDPRKI
jgi:hypothetical protein